LQQRLQLQQHVLGEGVDRLASAVERQHQHAVRALLDLPVAEAQSIEASDHAGPSVRVWGALYDPGVVSSPSNRLPEGARGPASRGMACGRGRTPPDGADSGTELSPLPKVTGPGPKA